MAAVLESPRGAVRVREIRLRELGPREALVRMEACGICHSDLFVAGLEKLAGTPLVLGHEGIGRVEALGEQAGGFAPGDRVGLTFLASTCGQCELCRRGRERFCGRQYNFGYTLDGALASWVVAPMEHLAPVPADLSAAEAAPLCCAGWTAYGALREAALAPGQAVALFGMGGLGHLAVQYARHFALRVAAVDPSEHKLELMRELGAEFTATPENAARALQKQFGGVDAAVVLTESPAAIQQAFRSLKRTGTLVLVGLPSQGWELPVVEAVLKGIAIRGSYLGSRQDLADVFELARLRVACAQVLPCVLSEVPSVLEQMRRGELVGRAVVRF